MFIYCLRHLSETKEGGSESIFLANIIKFRVFVAVTLQYLCKIVVTRTWRFSQSTILFVSCEVLLLGLLETLELLK